MVHIGQHLKSSHFPSSVFEIRRSQAGGAPSTLSIQTNVHPSEQWLEEMGLHTPNSRFLAIPSSPEPEFVRGFRRLDAKVDWARIGFVCEFGFLGQAICLNNTIKASPNDRPNSL